MSAAGEDVRDGLSRASRMLGIAQITVIGAAVGAFIGGSAGETLANNTTVDAGASVGIGTVAGAFIVGCVAFAATRKGGPLHWMVGGNDDE